MSEIKVKRGDTIVLNATCTRDGSPVNLTGATVWFTAKRSPDDADGAAIVQKTNGSGISVTSALNGQVTVTIAPGDTAGLDGHTTLFYDLQVKEADGRVTTFDEGKLILAMDITRTTV